MQNLLQVELGERSYPIHIQQAILSNFEYYPLKKGSKALIVTNETIAPLHLETVIETLKKGGVDVDHLILKDGEKFKDQDSWYTILTALLERNHTRKSTLIALGGGVIGDLVGFAASCYQRGIDFIQIPTTLLSQVDSSVGGKTAINHPLGKNMIGSFYQPKSVLIDINTLKTLPKREFSSGLAEVIKYGIILDYDFFCWLEKHIDELMQLDEKALAYCIHRCCQLKADVVAQDETEQGKRALLNLGHTYGHAIETELGYGHWLHGEAVAVGMVMAAHASRLLGHINESEIERIINLLKKAQLPTVRPELMPIDAYIPHMLRDKKVISGEIRLVLPLKIGESIVMDHIDGEIIKQSIGLTSL